MQRRPNAKTPAKQPSLHDRIKFAAMVPETVAPAADGEAGDKSSIHQALLDQFEETLRQVSDINPEERQLLSAHFNHAADTVVRDPANVATPQRSDWLETVEMLRQSGAVEEDEVNPLIRKLNAALEPLQSNQVQLAMEFTRRCKEHGEEQALEWFKAQSSAASEQESQKNAPPLAPDHPLASDAITQSRSRRLRGPPGN